LWTAAGRRREGKPWWLITGFGERLFLFVSPGRKKENHEDRTGATEGLGRSSQGYAFPRRKSMGI
jgi:hypothetical protein